MAVPVVRAGPVAVPVALLLAGCGTSRTTPQPARFPPALLAEARPIGRGARFQPPLSGPVIGRCAGRLGPRIGVHLELFAANRVVLVATGIGTRPPRRLAAGRITRAGCYGELVTLDPTGVVLLRPGARLTLSAVFRAWGQPLSSSRLASFTAPRDSHVSVFVDGTPWSGAPASVPLRAHSEIVLEVGPYVPPHRSYTFPPGT